MSGIHEKYRVQFDAWKLISAFGGVDGTFKVLNSQGCNIKRKTVAKWKERGNIPADAVASLIAGNHKNPDHWLDVREYIEIKE